MRLIIEQNERDRRFFEDHWQQWVKRNPPAASWLAAGWTLRQWAETEMPSIGWLGRLLWRLEMWLERSQ